MVTLARKTYGGLDIACNNAGIASPANPVAEVPLDVWRRTLSVDLDGVFHGIQAQIPAMTACGGGVIVNIASITGAASDAGPEVKTYRMEPPDGEPQIPLDRSQFCR